jgi:hypothetical protein
MLNLVAGLAVGLLLYEVVARLVSRLLHRS